MKKKTTPSSKCPLLSIFTLLSLFIFIFIFTSITPKSLFPTNTKTLIPQFPQCTNLQTLGHRFLWYAPHSGFSNQLAEFKNAILISAILNRTLIVPPILDHHAVALGSCPKFRVSSPTELRISVWNHVMELIRSRRYVSMGDIMDLSSLLSHHEVQTIDFRVFASLCGVNIDFSCFNDSNIQSSYLDNLRQCGSLLSGSEINIDKKCSYPLDNDCRNTVWTYQKNDNGVLDSFQPDKQLLKKKNIFHVRKRLDLYEFLGHSTDADLATVLAFGSLFTSRYKDSELFIDIHESPKDQRIQSVIQKIEFLPFVSEIVNAGKEFAFETIKASFICAQLRLLDGQFKNHWETTFVGFKQKVEMLKLRGSSLPIHIFIMTDLPMEKWSESYLGELARDSNSYKLHVLRADDELVIRTAKKLVDARRGTKQGLVVEGFDVVAKTKDSCPPQILPNVLLYIEEMVCSCSSLGFVGTAGSTITESIELMKRFGACRRER